MIQVRPAQARGHADHGWLNTYYTFSFADYQDPSHMRFRVLRVMNEDRIAPGMGFDMHGHRDMEIVTYILEGELEHRDSMGHGSVLRAGEFQRMSAGSGVLHSEFNPSATNPVHLYQIWLFPKSKGIQPSYDQKGFPRERKADRWMLVASPDGTDESLTIHQDARIFLANLSPNKAVEYSLAPERHAWLQVIRGAVTVNDAPLTPGDGIAISDETHLNVVATSASEVMLFDLP